MTDRRGRATGGAEGDGCGALSWDNRKDVPMTDRRGRATGGAEGDGCGALSWNE